MAKMGRLPDDPAVQKMTNLRWVVLGRTLRELEKEKIKNTVEILDKVVRPMIGTMLGVEFGDKKIVPLSAFVNIEGFKAVIEELEKESNPDPEVTSPEASDYTKSVFETDILAELSPEELSKMESLKFENLSKMEKLLGIKSVIEDE